MTLAADDAAPRLKAQTITDPERLRPYEIPERGSPGHAIGLLLPDSEAAVGELLRNCTAADVPLVISAGRTGLVEAQRPQGETVLSLERLKSPLVFELADGRRCEFVKNATPEVAATTLVDWWRAVGSPATAGASITVEAGMAVDALNLLLQPLGLVWPMEMGSSSAATVGACVANASAGANAVCYGTAAHLCQAAWGFWANGETVGPCIADKWNAPSPDRLAIDSACIRPVWELIGSQGVLGVITRLQLRTHALPAQREGALLPVADMPAAMSILVAARSEFGGDIEEFEFISRAALELVHLHKGEAFRSPLAEHSAPYYVLLQVKSASADEDLAGRLYALLSDTLNLPDAAIGYAPLPALKAIRHSITEASNARMRALGGGRLSFDTATPVAVFGEYLAALDAALKAQYPQIEFVAFGHAGVGGAHLHLLGTRESPVAAHERLIVDLVFDVTARFGGTFSAEHGVGPKWAAEYQRRVPADARESLQRAKQKCDPSGILNPRSFGLVNRHDAR